MRRRHSSHTWQPPAAEAAVKAARFLRVHRSEAQSLDGRRSGGYAASAAHARACTNSCCCDGFPAPESVSARTRDGSRRKRTPPRSLHVLTFPPGTIFGFHTTPQGMECHPQPDAKQRVFCFGGGKAAGDHHRRVHGPPRRRKAAPEGTAQPLQLRREDAPSAVSPSTFARPVIRPWYRRTRRTNQLPASRTALVASSHPTLRRRFLSGRGTGRQR